VLQNGPQRLTQLNKPERLSCDEGVQGNAKHQGLGIRELDHRLEVIDDHLSEIGS
jgi:hypothetical protein